MSEGEGLNVLLLSDKHDHLHYLLAIVYSAMDQDLGSHKCRGRGETERERRRERAAGEREREGLNVLLLSDKHDRLHYLLAIVYNAMDQDLGSLKCRGKGEKERERRRERAVGERERGD